MGPGKWIVLILLFISGVGAGTAIGHKIRTHQMVHQILSCAVESIRDYGDLCAESGENYPENPQLHYDGVECGTSFILYCLNIPPTLAKEWKKNL